MYVGREALEMMFLLFMITATVSLDKKMITAGAVGLVSGLAGGMLLGEFLEEVAMNSIALEDTIIGMIPELIQFKYFHSKLDKHAEIEDSKNIALYDKNFSSYYKKNNSLGFAGNGTFIRGCIQISHK